MKNDPTKNRWGPALPEKRGGEFQSFIKGEMGKFRVNMKVLVFGSGLCVFSVRGRLSVSALELVTIPQWNPLLTCAFGATYVFGSSIAGGEILGRFAAGGDVVSILGCRGGSLSPGCRGRDGVFRVGVVCSRYCRGD